MQENLKKVFMRSVCALNFEAMNILDPNEQNFAQAKMEQELSRQMDFAMQQSTPDYMQASQFNSNNVPPARSEISFNLSEANTHRDEEKDLMNMGLNVVPLDANERKIESKDSMWKPAPIIGREMTHNNSVHIQ